MNLSARTIALSTPKVHTFLALSLLLALFAAYMYFLSASVVHVIIRKEVNAEVAQLHSEIGQLESEYIKRQHAVSNEIANQKGFVAVSEKVFIARADSTLVLSSNQR